MIATYNICGQKCQEIRAVPREEDGSGQGYVKDGLRYHDVEQGLLPEGEEKSLKNLREWHEQIYGWIEERHHRN